MAVPIFFTKSKVILSSDFPKSWTMSFQSYSCKMLLQCQFCDQSMVAIFPLVHLFWFQQCNKANWMCPKDPAILRRSHLPLASGLNWLLDEVSLLQAPLKRWIGKTLVWCRFRILINRLQKIVLMNRKSSYLLVQYFSEWSITSKTFQHFRTVQKSIKN